MMLFKNCPCPIHTPNYVNEYVIPLVVDSRSPVLHAQIPIGMSNSHDAKTRLSAVRKTGMWVVDWYLPAFSEFSAATHRKSKHKSQQQTPAAPTHTARAFPPTRQRVGIYWGGSETWHTCNQIAAFPERLIAIIIVCVCARALTRSPAAEDAAC
jgi:hypothetical protein